MSSCGFGCIIVFTTLTLTIGCRDAFHSCSSWSKVGMCKNDKFDFVMRGGCAKTCGFCTSGNNTSVSSTKLNVFSNVDALLAKYKETSPHGCKDIFSRCQQWKELKNICKRKDVKKYLEYGCRYTCEMCGKPVITTRKSAIEHSAQVPTKKSLVGNWPEMDFGEANEQLDFEIGITKEMLKARKASFSGLFIPKARGQLKGLKGEPKKLKHDKQSRVFNGRKGHQHSLTKSKTRRVEIETGYKNPRSFSISEDETFDKFGTNLNTLDSFKGLSSLPEFDGASELSEVQNLLETPKTNKRVDYYTDHFSKDPYLAYSEREEWLKENEPHLKQFRRTAGKGLKKSRKLSRKYHNTRRHKRHLVKPLHASAAKKVVIENGFQDQFSHPESKDGRFKAFLDIPLKPYEGNGPRQLPFYDGMDKDDEREEWMKENELGPKSFTRRIK